MSNNGRSWWSITNFILCFERKKNWRAYEDMWSLCLKVHRSIIERLLKTFHKSAWIEEFLLFPPLNLMCFLASYDITCQGLQEYSSNLIFNKTSHGSLFLSTVLLLLLLSSFFHQHMGMLENIMCNKSTSTTYQDDWLAHQARG